MLENAAGPTALIPLTSVRARALSVPSVDGEGAISLRASCTAAEYTCEALTLCSRGESLLKAIATPLPSTRLIGATIQKVKVQLCLRNSLQTGQNANIIGQAIVQPRKTPPVPNLCWRGGKTRRSQIACDAPMVAMNMEIWKGEKPRPPSLIGVKQNTGSTNGLYLSVSTPTSTRQGSATGSVS